MKEKRNKKKRPKRLKLRRLLAQERRRMFRRWETRRERRARYVPVRSYCFEGIDPLCTEYPPIKTEGSGDRFEAYSQRVLSETACNLGIPAELLNRPFTNHPKG